MPEIHQGVNKADFVDIPPASPPLDPEDAGKSPEVLPKRDFRYKNNGILGYVHYLKNFPIKSPQGVYIQTCLYHGTKIPNDAKGKKCFLNSGQVTNSSCLENDAAGRDAMTRMGIELPPGQNDFVHPVDVEANWINDFYSL